MDKSALNRQSQVLYDDKWRILNKRTWLFRYIPFVEFVFGSGSLAVGNVSKDSDLDVLVCVKSGRIFTARFFSALFFSIFRWRRTKNDTHKTAANKVCLNHFITKESFALSAKPNEYWRILYKNLVPIYGSQKVMIDFFSANKNWIKLNYASQNDLRYQFKNPSKFKLLLEKLFSNNFGSWLEAKLKTYQIKKIEASMHNKTANRENIIRTFTGSAKGKFYRYQLPPIIVYTDTELEFHPDPAIIEISSN
jgi:hypothetical protein